MATTCTLKESASSTFLTNSSHTLSAFTSFGVYSIAVLLARTDHSTQNNDRYISSVTDTQGNVWTQLSSTKIGADVGDVDPWIQLFICYMDIPLTDSDSITCTYNATNNNKQLRLFEIATNSSGYEAYLVDSTFNATSGQSCLGIGCAVDTGGGTCSVSSVNNSPPITWQDSGSTVQCGYISNYSSGSASWSVTYSEEVGMEGYVAARFGERLSLRNVSIIGQSGFFGL